MYIILYKTCSYGSRFHKICPILLLCTFIMAKTKSFQPLLNALSDLEIARDHLLADGVHIFEGVLGGCERLKALQLHRAEETLWVKHSLLDLL